MKGNNKKAKQSKYKHDSLLLRTESYESIQYLPMMQKAMLLDKIFHYAMNEEEYVSEAEEKLEDNSFLSAMFNLQKNTLDYNWKAYEESKEQKQHNGKRDGIIGCLLRGQNISEDNITFLKENGYLTREYLENKGISEDRISYLMDDDE